MSIAKSSLAKFCIENIAQNPHKVRDMLVKMHEAGESVDEIVDFFDEFWARKIAVNWHKKLVFDVCGTGGSGKNRVNLSTILAIKLSKEFTIAKHGNRAISGRVGGFDILKYTGFEPATNPKEVIERLEKQNLAFVFAPSFQPSLAVFGEVRKSISHRTIFNIIGPLLNPVSGLAGQLCGVSDIKIMRNMAKVASLRGKNILFVHDLTDGLDDVSIRGKTAYIEVLDGVMTEGEIEPADYGLKKVVNFSEIAGFGEAEANGNLAKEILKNRANTAYLVFLEINYLVAKQFFNKICLKKS
jgi:anthranilate phosphoribosyltransferase